MADFRDIAELSDLGAEFGSIFQESMIQMDLLDRKLSEKQIRRIEASHEAQMNSLEEIMDSMTEIFETAEDSLSDFDKQMYRTLLLNRQKDMKRLDRDYKRRHRQLLRDQEDFFEDMTEGFDGVLERVSHLASIAASIDVAGIKDAVTDAADSNVEMRRRIKAMWGMSQKDYENFVHGLSRTTRDLNRQYGNKFSGTDITENAYDLVTEFNVQGEEFVLTLSKGLSIFEKITGIEGVESYQGLVRVTDNWRDAAEPIMNTFNDLAVLGSRLGYETGPQDFINVMTLMGDTIAKEADDAEDAQRRMVDLGKTVTMLEDSYISSEDWFNSLKDISGMTPDNVDAVMEKFQWALPYIDENIWDLQKMLKEGDYSGVTEILLDGMAQALGTGNPMYTNMIKDAFGMESGDFSQLQQRLKENPRYFHDLGVELDGMYDSALQSGSEAAKTMEDIHVSWIERVKNAFSTSPIGEKITDIVDDLDISLVDIYAGVELLKGAADLFGGKSGKGLFSKLFTGGAGKGFLSKLFGGGSSQAALPSASKGFFSNLLNVGKGFFSKLFTSGKGFFKNLLSSGKGFFSNLLAGGKGFFAKLFGGGASTAVAGKGFFGNLLAGGKGFFAKLFGGGASTAGTGAAAAGAGGLSLGTVVSGAGAITAAVGVIDAYTDLAESFEATKWQEKETKRMSAGLKGGMVAAGAAIGSIVPGVGTLIGAGVGGLVAILGGDKAARAFQNWADGTNKINDAMEEATALNGMHKDSILDMTEAELKLYEARLLSGKGDFMEGLDAAVTQYGKSRKVQDDKTTQYDGFDEYSTKMNDIIALINSGELVWDKTHNKVTRGTMSEDDYQALMGEAYDLWNKTNTIFDISGWNQDLLTRWGKRDNNRVMSYALENYTSGINDENFMTDLGEADTDVQEKQIQIEELLTLQLSNLNALLGGMSWEDLAASWDTLGATEKSRLMYLGEMWGALPAELQEAYKDLFPDMAELERLSGYDLDQNGAIDGSHENGLWKVPKDNYRALLHKDEAVLTKEDADQWRSDIKRKRPKEYLANLMSGMVNTAFSTFQNLVNSTIGNSQPNLSFSDIISGVGTNVEATIWKTLLGMGYSKNGVAGLMGNLYRESGFQSNNLENKYQGKLGFSDDSYTKAVDNGTYKNFVNDKAGYGLAQWTYWSRKKKLLEFAKQNGTSISDLGMQLAFLNQELMESYSGVYRVLKNASTVQEASDKVLMDFERPANAASKKGERGRFSMSFYNKYANMTDEELAEAAGLAKYEKGTDYVPKTQIALVHKGEQITPAREVEKRKSVVVGDNSDVIQVLRWGFEFLGKKLEKQHIVAVPQEEKSSKKESVTANVFKLGGVMG